MQLKNALIGAVVGGLIGVGILVAAFMFFGTQHTALALLVAVLVGGGVRAMVSTKGHASYLRGALTALVAIVAFVGGNFVVAQVARSQMAANASQPMRTAPLSERKTAATEGTESGDTAVEPVIEEMGIRRSAPVGGMRGPLKSAYSPWDFFWLSVATLVAYELGRGSGTGPVTTPPLSEAPATPAATA